MFTHCNKTFILLLCVCYIYCDNASEIEYLKNLINEGTRQAENYQLRTDAKIHEANNDNIFQEYGTYDFVIIGGGTSGSVVASRLSELDFQVLLLEAGNFSNNGFEQFIRFAEPFHMYTDWNWGYKSVPQQFGCLGVVNESCLLPRGKGVGGNTLINDAIYSRGHPSNFDDWARIVDDASWSYDEVLKWFKKSENFHSSNSKARPAFSYHGTAGELNVQDRIPDTFLTDAFVRANEELGYHVTDMNKPSQIGTSIYQYYVSKTGRRQDFGNLFLKPHLKRTNLKVLTGSYVTNIVINPSTKRATGAVFTNAGRTYRVKAKLEVILSAGVIGSPQILMLSGVGPKKHLQQHGITVIEDLEVGSTLRDQLYVDLRFSSNINIPEESLDDQLKDYIKGIGTLTAPMVNQALGFYKINRPGSTPNVEVFSDLIAYSDGERRLMGFKPEIYEALWGSNNTHVSFVIENLLPKSTGTVRLKDNNPFEYPLIDPNVLAHHEDIDVLYQGIQFILRLAQTRAYQRLGLSYIANPLPPCRHLQFRSKQYWYCFIRQLSQSAFHPVGTCPMGASRRHGVVDSDLKVFGIKGLRVVDSSVFPTQISGHPDVAALMIAEKISEIIKSEHSSKTNGF
ncbi:unnamed protein product [Phyllotreta striolata]|uniref:Uncharacterized protein n=1 Tax=Phyllotreta striolata TaxID=444603 RepID=A0A9N9TXP1_PHYSR|nr:unnamed protein product [Phyllotreta striolata]